MITKIFPIKADSHGFFAQTAAADPNSYATNVLFSTALDLLSQYQLRAQFQITFNALNIYNGYYAFYDNDPLSNNLIYTQYLNGRYHFLFKGLKYYPNISDLWYMNAMLTEQAVDPLNRKFSFASLQSFANINLGVDAMYLSMQKLIPDVDILEGLIDSAEPGIRLLLFVDKLEIVERAVTASKIITNLRFHYTIQAHAIEPDITGGGRYSDFNSSTFISQKSFFYEQTIPGYKRSDVIKENFKKTGWGHFLYPVVTKADIPPIKYVQLSDVLKVLYNGMIFSQSTDNPSLKVDSSSLSEWLNTNIELKNASTYYEPSSVTRKQTDPPAFAFTENNVLKAWLESVYQTSVVRGFVLDKFILSYDNIYWEPFNDSFAGDIYSDSPSIFMTRLTSYYVSNDGQSPIDEPGNFERSGGFVKGRRKYWLSNLIQAIADKADAPLSTGVTKAGISNTLVGPTPDKIMGSKFFPFYKFRQFNESNREKLEVITVPFVGAQTSQLVAFCDTSTKLKRVSSLPENKYTKRFTINPYTLPSSLGDDPVEIINNMGFVTYVKNDSTTEVIALDLNAGTTKTQIFGFLTWIFLNPSVLGDPGEWTRRGRYSASANDLSSKVYLGYTTNNWKFELNSGGLTLCDLLESGMYNTPEEAYIAYVTIVKNGTINPTPSPTDPAWKEFFDCTGGGEIIRVTTEYCDPSPAPDGRPVVSQIVKQRVKLLPNGTEQNVGNPFYEYPSTTIVLKNQTGQVGGKTVLGDRYLIYEKCIMVRERFEPYAVQPTGPTGPTGSSGVTGTTGPTGPSGGSGVVTGISVSFENFINPAQFKINTIRLSPSAYPITLELDKCYYLFEFDEQNLGTSPDDYVLKLSPGRKGQVLILQVNNLTYPYLGVTISNGDGLTSGSANQKIRISTAKWGNERYKSFLFLIFNGNDWVEFLRRDLF